MSSCRLVVELHLSQIVIHARLNSQQESLSYDQNVNHIYTSPCRTCQAYYATSPRPSRPLLSDSLVVGDRSRSTSFARCARIARVITPAKSEPRRPPPRHSLLPMLFLL